MSIKSHGSAYYNVVLNDNDWYELIMKDQCPEGRAYAGSFLNKNNLYIYGGLDLEMGHMNDFWCIDIKSLEQFY